jgi:hypothetical protein
MSSISGCTSTEDLPGANTYSQNESNWEWRLMKHIRHLVVCQDSQQAPNEQTKEPT